MKVAIIGAGISGLALAYFIHKKSVEKNEITIIESENLGGSLQTEHYKKCLLEIGSHDFYLDSSILQSMFQDIGLSLTPITNDFEKKFISKESQLMKAPPSFEKMNKTPVLFFTEKIKFSKALKKQYSFWPSMSIYEAFKSIFGHNAAEYLASPLTRYLFHAEAEDIELASAFPDLYAYLEQGKNITDAYYSVQADKKKLHHDDFNLKKNKIGRFTMNKGMSELIEQLSVHLKKNGVKIEFCKVHNILLQNTRTENKNGNKKYVIQSKNKTFKDYDSVVFATPTRQSSKILRGFDKKLSVLLSEMKESYTSTVYQAWSRKNFSMNGCGIFFPRIEKTPFLFILFLSNLYPEKCTSDIFLTRIYLSGDHTVFDDSDLIKVSFEVMKRQFRVKDDPLWSKVYRNCGLPKYIPKHSEWKNKIFTIAQQYPQLHFHGKAFQGLQIEQQIEASYLLANKILT